MPALRRAAMGDCHEDLPTSREPIRVVLPAFLGPLGPREIENLEEEAQWVTVRRGEALFRQGDPADG